MKKLLVAILFATVTLGTVVGPASAQQMSKAEKRRLFLKGAKLWPIYCNQCHHARPPAEKAPYEWQAEIIHMGTLGSFPADDRRALLQYLMAR